jgi:DNA-binding response OmpR family regulator
MNEGELGLSAAPSSVRGPELRILAVDDDAHLLGAYRGALGGAGHELVTAGSGAEARVAVAAARFDLVILDLMLADGHGTDLIPELLALRPRPPAIAVVSGFLDAGTALDLAPQGVLALPKPPTTADLRRVVELARQRRPTRGALLEEFAVRHDLGRKQSLLLACVLGSSPLEERVAATDLSPEELASCQRSLLRKLGVASEPEAISLFLEYVLERMNVR